MILVTPGIFELEFLSLHEGPWLQFTYVAPWKRSSETNASAVSIKSGDSDSTMRSLSCNMKRGECHNILIISH